MNNDQSFSFEDVVHALKDVIGEENTEEMLYAWSAGESEMALEWLITVVVGTKPALTDEVYRALIELAKEEDDSQKQEWQKTNQEMTPEDIKRYELKPPQADLVERLEHAFPDRKQ